MRWMITDSGLGGLSVCAGLEQGLKEKGLGAGIELLYVNATPDEHIGYNSLKTQAERIDMFNRFLTASYERFSPDEIAIACNTLSVIYEQTEFSKHSPVDVRGIVEAGVTLCDEGLAKNPDHGLIIFGTETTTEAGTYPRSITSKGSPVVTQACPNLASAITRDTSGAECKNLLKGYTRDSLAQFHADIDSVYALLACTHYGYQAQVFTDMIKEQGLEATILNPNELMVDQLLTNLKNMPDSSAKLSVRFVSRFPLPESETRSMTDYLKDAAPLTLEALNDQEVIPDLFQI